MSLARACGCAFGFLAGHYLFRELDLKWKFTRFDSDHVRFLKAFNTVFASPLYVKMEVKLFGTGDYWQRVYTAAIDDVIKYAPSRCFHDATEHYTRDCGPMDHLKNWVTYAAVIHYMNECPIADNRGVLSHYGTTLERLCEHPEMFPARQCRVIEESLNEALSDPDIKEKIFVHHALNSCYGGGGSFACELLRSLQNRGDSYW